MNTVDKKYIYDEKIKEQNNDNKRLEVDYSIKKKEDSNPYIYK